MKMTFAAAAALAVMTAAASASSPAIIKDAGSNPIYFGSTAGQPDTQTGPLLKDPKAFNNGRGE